ncbi:uncharacterized protein METZ01_LOCUS485827, partial [marine metagenome]
LIEEVDIVKQENDLDTQIAGQFRETHQVDDRIENVDEKNRLAGDKSVENEEEKSAENKEENPVIEGDLDNLSTKTKVAEADETPAVSEEE